VSAARAGAPYQGVPVSHTDLARWAGRAHRARLGGLAFAAALAAASWAAGAVTEGGPPPAALRAALDAACTAPQAGDAVLAALGGGIVLEESSLKAPPGMEARRHRLLLPSGARVRLDTHRGGGGLRQVILEVEDYVAARRRPRVWVVADGGCGVRVARRLLYRDDGVPHTVEVLGTDLSTVRSRLALDEPVPPGSPPAGVPVAVVDSGVNYTLAPVARRLARDGDGRILGWDYWDDDPRPFDSHPSRSPFLPARHGTRTASVLLQDAPVATLVPMRYPRADMSRMAALVGDVASHGVGIVNLSLGGREAEPWRAFEAAARAHPDILFVASAGNDGRDLDRDPVYPAVLALDNLVTVTSSDAEGRPAPGSNWGAGSVDLAVPAEGLIATGFSGYARPVSGSSYAAARVSALAACLKAANPGWGAAELKAAIFALARPPATEEDARLRVGALPDPVLRARGACPAEPSEPQRIGRLELDPSALHPGGPPASADRELAPLTVVWVEGAGWPLEAVVPAVARAAAVHAQCGVRFGGVEVQLWRLPRRLRYYHTRAALELTEALGVQAPAVWLVRDTLEQPAFDAEAIGRSNARGREGLAGTLWLTSHLEHPGEALAHELYHVLADSGSHVPERDNLMHAETRPGATRLTEGQCERARRVGEAFGLLRASPGPD
jgi:hypothetical protein